MTQDNLTNKQLGADGQSQYAIFLPALSGFYSSYIGKQRGGVHVEPARMPANIPDMEMLNWLNDQKALFPYKWSLYSAGHANLDINKQDWAEDMVRNRDPNTFLLGDSGGFQIGKGRWEGDWKNPACPKAKQKREQVLAWMDAYMDYGMVLDVPTWITNFPQSRKVTGINTYQDAVDATYINNEYFIANRSGKCKFLNVLQGGNQTDAHKWYNTMKKYCDPKQYPGKHFNGWALGGQHTSDIELVLKRIVTLRFEGLLEEGLHDWMHFLGIGRLEWALMLTDIQRAVRKYHNPNFTVSFDCASPFLATANGQVYHQIDIQDRKKWCYRMSPIVDDKKYATDTRTYRDAVMQDGLIKHFDESPMSANFLVKDICYYKDGVPKTPAELGTETFDPANPAHYAVVPALNKIGKIGRTSWDSFSYALLMGHNVWTHIESVQRSNREYDAGICPIMLVEEKFEQLYFRDLVDAIFSIDNLEDALAFIEYHDKFWQRFVGTKGATGKKTVNSRTMFDALFEIPDYTPVDEPDLDETKLEDLEKSA